MEIGMKGSPAHILTNDKMTGADKKAAFKEITKESAKDTLIMSGAAAAAGTAAVAVAGKDSILSPLKTGAGKLLSKVPVEVKGQNLKELIKNSKVYTKLNALPPAAKVIMASAAAAIPLVGSYVTTAKAGYIEGQHESKD